MSDWTLIFYCGLITFLSRFSMIALLKKEIFNNRIREILADFLMKYIETVINYNNILKKYTI